ncbi:MAG: ABC transporter ATP-binding protein [Negativicutes bacterium]|nr:ABC transporter ATP-binding protein [Negativicutes bacterium]
MQAIKINEVYKSYGAKEVLKGINLTIDEGEIFGFVGPNGVGKTTLIECILGMREITSGNIDVFGLDAKRDHSKFVRLVGAQLQHAEISPNLKTKEAVVLQAGLFKTRVNVCDELEKVGLRDQRNTFFSKLSGGQKQRLLICLASVHKPKILFFDELSTGLDPISRRDAWGRVLQLKGEGKTIILTTHFMDEIESVCDRVAVLKDGKIHSADTPANLVAKLPYHIVYEFESADEIAPVMITADFPMLSVAQISDMQYRLCVNSEITETELSNYMEHHGYRIQRIKKRKTYFEDYYYDLFTGRKG